MKVKIPKIIRRFTAKHISKIVSKEIGIDTNIENYEIILDTKGDSYRVYFEVSATANKKETNAFIKRMVKDSFKRKGQ